MSQLKANQSEDMPSKKDNTISRKNSLYTAKNTSLSKGRLIKKHSQEYVPKLVTSSKCIYFLMRLSEKLKLNDKPNF